MKIKYIVYALLIIGIGGFIAYRISENKSEKNDNKDKGSQKPMVVNAVVVAPQDFENQLSLSGSIEANEQVEIRSEISGIVEGIYFTEGTDVKKGQVLLKVNDIELRAQRAEMATKQGLASENERRAKLLLEKQAISQEEYDIARADFKSAQAQTQLINAQITKTSVRAPFSGKIGLRSISPGTYVTPENLIAKLVNSGQLKITFSIPEKYASQIKINSQITFTVAGSKQKYAAQVYALEPEIAIDTRTLKIRAIAENKNGNLLPGTFANVELPLATIKDAIIVPTEAIVPVQNGKKLFVTSNGKAKEIMVETATRTAKDIVVLSGLKAGDTVLTTGVMTLKNDSPVTVKVIKVKNKQS